MVQISVHRQMKCHTCVHGNSFRWIKSGLKWKLFQLKEECYRRYLQFVEGFVICFVVSA